MVINRSVLGQAPLSISITVVAVALIMLFTIIEPEASQGLGFWQRMLFWTLQVNITLIGILLASMLIRFIGTFNISDIWLLMFTGIIASILVSPFFVGIEKLFTLLDRTPDSVLDEFAETGLLPAILVQSMESALPLTVAWLIINLPILLKSSFLHKRNNDSDPDDDPTPGSKANGQKKEVEQFNSNYEKDQFLKKLPENIGQNIMYVTSELHYLNVTTDTGSALVLGSIAKLAEIYEDNGFLVHRSHWVHKDYVSRVVVTGGNASCVMQDGKSIPISRSKKKLLKAYFGNNNSTAQNNVVDLASKKELS